MKNSLRFRLIYVASIFVLITCASMTSFAACYVDSATNLAPGVQEIGRKGGCADSLVQHDPNSDSIYYYSLFKEDQKQCIFFSGPNYSLICPKN